MEAGFVTSWTYACRAVSASQEFHWVKYCFGALSVSILLQDMAVAETISNNGRSFFSRSMIFFCGTKLAKKGRFSKRSSRALGKYA